MTTDQSIKIEKDIKDLRDKLWDLKRDLVAGKVKNIKEIKVTKKSIARLLTTINKKHETRN